MDMSLNFTAACAANDGLIKRHQRERTVPIPLSITPIPGYPDKLALYKMAASPFWQVRCWMMGRTHRRSTKTHNLKRAQQFAKAFFEELVVYNTQAQATLAAQEAQADALNATGRMGKTKTRSFGDLAELMFANEQSRCDRGEFSRGSVQVLRNRLDVYVLPRWGQHMPQEVDFSALLAFVQMLSAKMSSITVSQYLVVVRKVLSYAVSVGSLAYLPEFPKIKVSSTSRGAFTPSEYWRIVRTARQLRGQAHPQSRTVLRTNYKLRSNDLNMPPDVAWCMVFMVNSFIRPSDLKTLKHKHVEVVRHQNTYLRLTLPATKKHDKPMVTLQPAVRVYERLRAHHGLSGKARPEDYLFLPHIKDRNYALMVLSLHFNWILRLTGLKQGALGQDRSLYSLRHSSITFRLLYGQGIDLLTLARNARTSVNVINNHYASTVSSEQNIGLLQSRRPQMSRASG